MPLKQLISVSVIVATLPAATFANTWDEELKGLFKRVYKGEDAAFEGLDGAALTDAQADNEISITAFLKFVHDKNSGDPDADKQMTPAAYAAFKKADADEDLHLSPDEWKTLMASLRPNHDERLTGWIRGNQFPNTFDPTWEAAAPANLLRRQDYSDQVQTIVTAWATANSVTGLVGAVVQARSVQAFNTADADDDEQLTQAEFKNLVVSNNIGAGPDAFKTWVEGLAARPINFVPNVHTDLLSANGLANDNAFVTEVDTEANDLVDLGWGSSTPANDAAPTVNADDEIDEEAFLRWVARPNPNWDPVTVAKAKDLFDSWDGDRTASLSKKEIAKAYTNIQKATDAAALAATNSRFTASNTDWALSGHGLNPPLIGGTPPFLDSNDDGVSITEFLIWAKDKDSTEAIVPKILTAFNAADTNRDALLDGDELKTMLASLTPPATESTPIVADTSTASSECFTNDVDYWGHDIGHARIGRASAADCQRKCGTVSGAKYFQFEPQRNSKPSVCWCKSSRAGAKPHTHRTVGPISCPNLLVGAWESRVVDKPTNGVAIVGAVMGSGSLALALAMWLAGKRYSGRPQQMEAVPLQVQE